MKLNKELERFWKNKTVLVTGNTGFKGSWLTQILTHFNANVVGVSKKHHDNNILFRKLKLGSRITNSYGDVCDYSKLEHIFDKYKPDYVFHLAAQSIVSVSYHNPIETFNTNILGTANVVHLCLQKQYLKGAAIITSDKCYENQNWLYPYREIDKLGGHDPYSSSKACAEIVTKSLFDSSPQINKKIIHTYRAGNVIGGGDYSRDRIIPDAMRCLFNSSALTIRSPKAIRPWQHVLEPILCYVSGLYLADKNKSYGFDSFNIGPDKFNSIEVGELVNMINKHSGYLLKIIYNNNKNFKETNLLTVDNSYYSKTFNWKPRWDIQMTIERTYNWYKTVHDGLSASEACNSDIKAYFQNE